MRREDLDAGRARRDENGERVRRLGILGPVGDSGLVAVVAVGDQQWRRQVKLAAFDPPGAGAHATLVDIEQRLAVRPGEQRIGVVEKEDRLELRPRRTKEAETAFLRAGVGSLVRQHIALVVRGRRDRRGEAFARAGDAVRADVVLRDPPVALGLLGENSPRPPRCDVPARLLLGLGQCEMNDVVRVARQILEARLVRDDVVRGSDEIGERAGGGSVVAQRSERPHRRHAWSLMVRTLEAAAAWIDDVGLALRLSEGRRRAAFAVGAGQRLA